MDWAIFKKLFTSAVTNCAQYPAAKMAQLGNVVDLAWRSADTTLEMIEIESVGDDNVVH